MRTFRFSASPRAAWRMLALAVAILCVLVAGPVTLAALATPLPSSPPSPTGVQPALGSARGPALGTACSLRQQAARGPAAAAHVYAFAYSDQDVALWEVTNWMWSDVFVSGAPAGALVAWVDIDAVVHGDVNDLAVRYCPEAAMHDVANCRPLPGSAGTHLTDFAGYPVNGRWWLGGIDRVADGDPGSIDYWNIRVYYAVPSPQPTPTATPTGLRTVDLPAIADAMTSQGNQFANFGKTTALHAGYLRQLRSWFMFDIASANIPRDTPYLHAELMLWHQANGDLSLDVFTPLAPWSETVLAWRNQPDLDLRPVASRWVSNVGAAWERWNVTQLAGEWLLGTRPNYGLVLTDRHDTMSAIFASREAADARQRPILRISYAEQPRTPTSTGEACLTPTPTATPSVTPTPTATLPPPPYVQRVNAGGPAYTDVHGHLWAADQAFSAGGWGHLGGRTFSTGQAIADSADDPLYQSERYWDGTAAPAYRFTVPNAWYQVTLKFAEIYRTAPNQRKFSIVLEGVTVLVGYDPVAAAGGRYRAAPDLTFVAPVSDGELAIAFIHNPLYDGPKVSAIEVLALEGGAATQTPTPTRTGEACLTPTATRTGEACLTPTCLTPTATSTPTATHAVVQYEQRVNAGGAVYTDSFSHTWAADRSFTLGSWGYVGGAVFATTQAIANSADDPLYQSERYWGESAAPGYRFTVPNGAYRVTLKFAEIYRAAPNSRKFGVAIEGVTQLVNYDPFAAAGGRYIAAPDAVFLVNVVDNMLEIDFLRNPLYDGPKISAIAVVQQ